MRKENTRINTYEEPIEDDKNFWWERTKECLFWLLLFLSPVIAYVVVSLVSNYLKG